MPQISITDAQVDTDDGPMPVKVIRQTSQDGMYAELMVTLQDAKKMASFLITDPEPEPEETEPEKKLEVVGADAMPKAPDGD